MVTELTLNHSLFFFYITGLRGLLYCNYLITVDGGLCTILTSFILEAIAGKDGTFCVLMLVI